jgi:SAM-dependent methyltransferase
MDRQHVVHTNSADRTGSKYSLCTSLTITIVRVDIFRLDLDLVSIVISGCIGMSRLDAESLSALHHIDANSPLAGTLTPSTINNFAKTQVPQTSHRIEIVKAWDLPLDGQTVLEIGCGQGDASVVLARAVGGGRVTAWDPASPDYGKSRTRLS